MIIIHKKYMIVSSDRDFLQLQRFRNVRQFSPLLKKELSVDNPRVYLQNHIIRGDKGDGIPNILSEDNVLLKDSDKSLCHKRKLMKSFKTWKKVNYYMLHLGIATIAEIKIN